MPEIKRVQLVALFNTVCARNIGLENFLKTHIEGIKTVLVVKQSRASALKNLRMCYSDTAINIIAPEALEANVTIGSLKALTALNKAVLHAHHAQAAVTGAIARCLMRSRLITTAHNNFGSYKFKHKLAFFFAFLLSDSIICNSKGTEASLPWFINRAKMRVIYNGVDFAKLDEVLDAQKPQSEKEKIVVGTVCRMVKQKDLPTLLRGFSKAYRCSETPLCLRLVGDGDQRSLVQELTRELDIEDVVELLGSVSREEVYRQLVDMDIFVVSSRWEGFCNAMVEAAAAGKAIIATDITPLPEVIGQENALFFGVGDSDTLAEKILMLSESMNLRQEKAIRAREFVRHRYSLEESAMRYQEVYEQLMVSLDLD